MASPPPTRAIEVFDPGSAKTRVVALKFGPRLIRAAAAVIGFIAEAVAAGESAPRSYSTSPVSAFRTTACKVPREGLAACSATEQVLTGEGDGLGDGLGDALRDALGDVLGLAFCVSEENAKPPRTKRRTKNAEPPPIRPSFKYGNFLNKSGNLLNKLANWLSS